MSTDITSRAADGNYFEMPPYGVPQAEKAAGMAAALSALTEHHRQHCAPYDQLLTARGEVLGRQYTLEQLPFIPVQLFKRYELSSVPPEQVFKVLTSSGTTSQQVSRIVLDRDTAQAQTRALVRIVQQFLGKARLPMLVIDHPGVIKNRQSFSARGAGILGLSNFGRDHTYALRDEDMTPDVEAIRAFIERHRGKQVFLFGFTFMVWKYLLQALRALPDPPRFENAVLIHSGGWKKLQDEAVGNDEFKQALGEVLNIDRVHNFYGMVEQVGSIFMECEAGRLHAPVFADVLIRDARTWQVLPPGQSGLIQVLSVLPHSYPGHSLLTEDVGELVGVDDCPCGRLGHTLRVHGRVARAEVRGCSDTHESPRPSAAEAA
ncbi:LuxE/PaaK family acyltransferase [Duganella phyllosphaerae]|uniref:Acyl-protein synthetase, LuxE n=1 Tax=Duganella phyllosphaerae TaxID=762836 RepID=A0A1E7X6U9_9BURK|nr:acyl-protein synthetase [Duganella phyllosphaerae]OFA08819.1 acyl-protein synthetase, LuxE [Duganella phyllosphaerae]